MWSPYSATCTVFSTPNKMTISSSETGIVKATWKLEGSTTRPSSTVCPATAVAESGPYIAVEVSNPTNFTATITAFQSKSASGTEADLVIWGYESPGLPQGDADIKACKKAADSCTAKTATGTAGTSTDNICGNTKSNLNLASVEGLQIPPGGKIIVFSATYSKTTAAGDATFVLNLRTDKLQ